MELSAKTTLWVEPQNGLPVIHGLIPASDAREFDGASQIGGLQYAEISSGHLHSVARFVSMVIAGAKLATPRIYLVWARSQIWRLPPPNHEPRRRSKPARKQG